MNIKKPQSYAPYGWIISEDLIPMEGKKSERGIVGPANVDPEIEKHLQDTLNRRYNVPFAKFRMSDADGEVYYKGYITGKYTGSEPLDDFGMPNAGAIYIQYLNKDGQYSSTIEAN
tara:strand:+ start:231 stop:578 length:348 start_codon:yes stop_codon:yes gene_type:complete